ncbi:MAG: hypothetical protein ACKVI4_09915 [Actinomycetales bacterium]
MEDNPWPKWMIASGVMAGLALPSIGTFYALRLQYPTDAFIMGLSIASLALAIATVCVFGVGVALVVRGIVQDERERRIGWATRGEGMRESLDYWQRILERESEYFVRLYADEQEFRDANPEKPRRPRENALLGVQEAEVQNVRQRIASLKADYLKLMPRNYRRRVLSEWSAELNA